MKNTTEFYAELARKINWYHNANKEYKGQAMDQIRELEEKLPYGSGFDAGSAVDLSKSTGQKIVIDTSFHHMNENGYYDGWTDHQVIVTPCLMYGYKLRITGRDRNQIKEYIRQQFDDIIR